MASRQALQIVPSTAGWIPALRFLWRYLRATPWLCDGLVLGATVAAISSTSALAFSSALMRIPKPGTSASTAAALRQAVFDTTCHECTALRLFSLNSRTSSSNPALMGGHVSTLLGFSTDTLVTETFMSFLISFIIVTFSVFLVRELR